MKYSGIKWIGEIPDNWVLERIQWHLDEIKESGAELIEMETSTFYTLMDLFEVPSIALLAVSDNSATGVPLLGRDEELAEKYGYTRSVVIPDLIFKIAGMK